MGGKAKPTKHTTAEIKAKEKAATVSVGGGKGGIAGGSIGGGEGGSTGRTTRRDKLKTRNDEPSGWVAHVESLCDNL